MAPLCAVNSFRERPGTTIAVWDDTFSVPILHLILITVTLFISQSVCKSVCWMAEMLAFTPFNFKPEMSYCLTDRSTKQPVLYCQWQYRNVLKVSWGHLTAEWHGSGGLLKTNTCLTITSNCLQEKLKQKKNKSKNLWALFKLLPLKLETRSSINIFELDIRYKQTNLCTWQLLLPDLGNLLLLAQRTKVYLSW